MVNQVGVGGEGIRIPSVTGAIPPDYGIKSGSPSYPKLRSAPAEPRLGVNFDLEIAGNEAARLVREHGAGNRRPRFLSPDWNGNYALVDYQPVSR
jgi:hypothetical protein